MSLPDGFDDMPEGFDDMIDNALDLDNNEGERVDMLRKQKKSTKQQRRRQKSKKYLPPDHIRSLLKEQGDLRGTKNKELRNLYVGSMQYMPLAIYKFLENMPMPWESQRDVNVTYNVRGVLSLIDDTPKVAEPVYQAQWGSVWSAMRMHKFETQQSGGHFQRVTFPIFDGDTPPVNYEDFLLKLSLPKPIVNPNLDEEQDKAVIDWLYIAEPILTPPNFVIEGAVLATVDNHFHPKDKSSWAADRKGGRWYFDIETISTLYRLSRSILNEHKIDKNWYFLWDMKSFYTAKALHLGIPRAPKFEPLHYLSNEDRIEQDEDWTEFNDLNTQITRDDPRRPAQAMMTERQIQFPYMYSREVRSVHIAPYHHPVHVAVPIIEDDTVPCFTFNPSLNNIVAVEKNFTDKEIKAAIYAHRRDVIETNKAYIHGRSAASQTSQFSTWVDIADDEAPPGLCPLDADDLLDFDCDLQLPDDFMPFLSDLPLEHETTKSGIAMCEATDPFNAFKGGMKRRIDVDVLRNWAEDPVGKIDDNYPQKVKESYTKQLKRKVARGLKNEDLTLEEIMHGLSSSAMKKEREAIPRTLDKFKQSDYFQQTTLDWLEAGLQLINQGHTMLRQLLNLKGLPYVHITYNFDAQPTRELTTKERKKSRLGHAFHLLRELLKVTKYIVDIHVSFRQGRIDSYQLADGLNYLFTHLGKLTSIYQYKYRVMRQARQTRDIKHMIYHRFNTGEVQKGPGNGFWAPTWRVWIFFVRGLVPLLNRFVANLVNRMFEGRKYRAAAHRITKQRIEADTDLMVRDDFRKEVMSMLPEGVEGGAQGRQLKLLEDHLSDAFRCWKRHAVWDPKEMHQDVKALIRKYVARKADNYKLQAQFNRERINNADSVDKNMFKKNLGRLTRLKLMEEQDRQKSYLREGPYINENEAKSIYGMVAEWLSSQQFQKIPFPAQSHRAEIQLLQLALSRLNDQHNIGNRLVQSQREEKQRIEVALDHPQETLAEIRSNLARLRLFKPLDVEFMDHFSHLTPLYSVEPKEKMIDAYLDSYLWFEATERRLFPNWCKPADSEPLPVLVHKWCEGINNSPQIWETAHGETVAMFQTTIGEDFYNNVDLRLFRKILELIMDKTLVEYIMAHHNVTMKYRDMEHTHEFGLIRGFQFSAFLAQVWGLVIDLMVLGSKRAQQLAGVHEPNRFLEFRHEQHATCHTIRGYSRYNDQINILLRFNKEQADELRRNYVEEQRELGESTFKSINGFKNKKCWPRDSRMRLNLPDVNLARAVFADFQGRLPAGIVDLSWDNSFVSIYSSQNPNLLFDLGGFEVRIQPTARIEGAVLELESMWRLRNNHTKELTARAYLQVTKKHVKQIQNKIRFALMTVGNSTFQAIAAKWNAVLGEIIPFYRESIAGTSGLQQIFVKGEKKMQQRVMMALNSKAAARFPPVIFYAPAEPTGGLGMLSVAQSLIPASDAQYSTITATGVQAFASGLTNIDGASIPNVLNYFTPWESEIEEGKKAWQEYSALKRDKRAQGLQLSSDEIAHLMDKGIPRIRTQFMADAPLYRFDKGFRSRQEFQQFIAGKFRKDWWYHRSHDGKIYGSLERYKKDMIDSLGGVGCILEHSLFKATGLTSWEGLLWNHSGSFEKSKKDAKITKAQRGGLTNVPNRRFALWWSPTINRSNIFAGFAVQIPTTGIFMHGKLTAIQKSLIGAFDKNRWSRIHAGVVGDIAKKLLSEECQELLRSREVSVEQIHPHKPFTFKASMADIILTAVDRFQVSTDPSLLIDSADVYGKREAQRFWIDVQLRWGNYDNHNVAMYARQKFTEYTTDRSSKYPSSAGVVIAIDLAYCCVSAFGYWIPELKGLMQRLISAVNTSNMQLTELRDLLKRALQLQTANPTESNLTTSNFAELFSDGLTTWIVDDSQTRFKGENGAVTILNPLTGDLFLSIVHKSVFVGQKRGKNLAIEKAADAIKSWIQSIPQNERPKKIIVTRSRFRPKLNAVLSDPSISVIATDLNLVVSQLLNHSRLGALRTDATSNVSHRLRVYDDWLQHYSPHTAYRMLQTILRGFFVDKAHTLKVLEPDHLVKRAPNHFWPTYERQGWQGVIVRIEEMIIADACGRLKISPADLTQADKTDIIMGKRLSDDEAQKEELEELAKLRAQRDEAHAGNKKKTRHDDASDDEPATVESTKIDVVRKKARSKFEDEKIKEVDWRKRAINASSMPVRCKQVFVDDLTLTSQATPQLVFPDDILQKFLRSCDTRRSVLALAFGRKLANKALVSEVACLVIPPQRGKIDTVAVPFAIPTSHPLLNANTGLHFLGIVRSQIIDHTPNTTDAATVLRTAASLAAAHDVSTTKYQEQVESLQGDEEADIGEPPISLLATDRYDPIANPFFITIAAISDADVVINTNVLTTQGYQATRDKESESHNTANASTMEEEHLSTALTSISPQISGFLLAPDIGNGMWNFEVIGQVWRDNDKESAPYEWVAVDTPYEFFSSQHRPDHFRNFTKTACADDEIDVMDGDDVFN